MKAIPKNRFQRLKRHYQTSICSYCSVELTRHNTTRDHIVPRALAKQATDGNHENLTLCCMECNARKGDSTPEAWGSVLLMAFVGSIVRRKDEC